MKKEYIIMPFIMFILTVLLLALMSVALKGCVEELESSRLGKKINHWLDEEPNTH
jgi:hypothetical protein